MNDTLTEWKRIKASDLRVGMQLCVALTPTVTLKYLDHGGITTILTDDGLERRFPCDHVIGVRKPE